MPKKKTSEVVEEIKKVSKKKRGKKKKIQGEAYTGSDLLNLAVGGDLPYGYSNIVGDSSAGKSFISGECVAMSHHKLKGKLQFFYDDAEKGFRFKSMKLWGVDVLNGGFFKPSRRSNTLQDFMTNIYEVIAKKDPDLPFIYVIDSWDSITSDEEMEFMGEKIKANKKKQGEDEDDDGKGKKQKGTYGLGKQKGTHAFFRSIIRDLQENKIHLIIVSQCKQAINAFSFAQIKYRTGGVALDYYATVIIWLAEVEKHNHKNRAYGITSKARVSKSRNDRPFRECYIDILFQHGVDNIASNLKFLYKLKTDTGKDKKDCKKKQKWEGDEFANLEELIHYIGHTEGQKELLLQKVNDKWEEIEEEVSAISNSRAPKW